MAHRPLYRVLGETSLELKCLSLFGAFSLLVISASFLSYWYVTGQVVTKQNPVTGKLLAKATMLFTHWEGLQDWFLPGRGCGRKERAGKKAARSVS